jgi:hypothetical protein
MRWEAADPKRRDVLRAARRSARGAVTTDGLLAFLSGASDLLGGRASRPRPRPGTGRRYLL